MSYKQSAISNQLSAISGKQPAMLTPGDRRILGMVSDHLEIVRGLVNVLHDDVLNEFMERLHGKGIFIMELDDIRSVANALKEE